MKHTFTAKQGIIYINKNPHKIIDIKLVLNSKESYLQFSISYSSIDVNTTLWELIPKIPKMSFTSTRGYRIKISDVVPVSYTSSKEQPYLSASGKLKCSKDFDLKCQFTDFCIEKGKHNNTDYEMKFFVSNHKFTQDFTTKINDTNISFDYKTSCFIFPKTKVYQGEPYTELFSAIQYLYALYYGYFFRHTYIKFKNKNYCKIYGNINVNFELFHPIKSYYFCDTKNIDFKTFLNEVFLCFYNRQEAWRLNLLIVYYLLFTRTRFLQIQFLLLSIFMEALKFSYGKNIAQFIEGRPGQFFKKNLPFWKKWISCKNSTYCFEEMLELVYKHLEIPNGYTKFITNRNSVVHSGNIPRIHTDDIFPLENQVREILKQIIEFKGTIYYQGMQGGEYR